jgi:inosine-uridine nucleoside N-ribohydrolase
MEFFAAAYASQMGFASGPPVHDFLCVAYLLDASLFAPPTPSAANGQADEEAKRYRVEVQTSEGHNLGATVVAFHDQWPIEHEGWAAGGRNVRVLEHLDVSLFASLPSSGLTGWTDGRCALVRPSVSGRFSSPQLNVPRHVSQATSPHRRVGQQAIT